MGVKVALGAGFALIAVSVALVLTGSPPRVVGGRIGGVQEIFGQLHGRARACQGDEQLPAGATAVRLDLEAVIGPSVAATAQAGGRVLASGTTGSGWTGADVTVPVGRIREAAPDATVCIALGPSREPVTIIGPPRSASATIQTSEGALRGRLGVEYLAPGDRSWWSQIPEVARRVGLGRIPSGTWVALLAASLMLAAVALAFWLAVARRTSAAWGCALVAFLSAASWSILTPPFQTPDEPAHFAYVQQLAEAHRLPVGDAKEYSPEEQAALEDLHHAEVQFMPSAKTISLEAEQRKLEHDLGEHLSRRGPGDAGTAANEPPLYYTLELVPYELGSGGSLLLRLQLMRLLSALLGAITALFGFMFVRETLPGAPWTWTSAGLAMALAPLLGFVSGSVNPDTLLAAISALLLYLLARAFRRGLTPRLGAAVGATIVAGLVTKLNFLGLVPGVLIALLVIARRAPAVSRRSTYKALAIAVAIAVSPAVLYPLLEPVLNPASVHIVSSSSSGATQAGRILDELSYIWQLYLPRLPGMTSYFPGIWTTRQLWFDGFVGLYGALDTVFPGWVDDLALIPAALLALLCLRALVAERAALRRRAPELLVYAAMAFGLLVLVGAASYASDVLGHEEPFREPRYLLPLLPLFGLAIALAAKGAGRRWGPACAALIVTLFLAHDLFSQLLVVARYYG